MSRHRADKIPKDEIIADLKRVAESLGFREFTQKEFLKLSQVTRSKAVMYKNFGTWEEALKEAGLELKPDPEAGMFIPDRELFAEMERIWRLCGHRPSKSEWGVANPKFSYGTYKRRFGGWVGACERFIEFQTEAPPVAESTSSRGTSKSQIVLTKENVRNIPLGVRLKVLERDGFRCTFCGRSPATEQRIRLHVDHVIPFALGGRTEIGNLQTLCNECNWGKGANSVGQ
jgi:hypothetical protein